MGALHRRFLLLVGLSVGLLSRAPAHTQLDETKLPRVPVGAAAAQVTGRLVGGGGISGEYELLCYLTFLEASGASLFVGEVTERNAQFALRSDRFRFQVIQNGSMIHFGRLDLQGTVAPAIRVYNLASPNRDFSRPDSLSEGQLVGVLRTRGIQGNLTPSMMFRAEGSVSFESAADFIFEGRTTNLKSIVGDSLTVSLGGVPPSAADFAGARSLSVPFSGTIVAAKKFRDTP